MLSRWFGVEQITLISSMTPGECIARLKNSVQSERLFVGTSDVVGRVSQSSFELGKHQPFYFRNAFPAILSGTVTQESSSTTRIDCRVGMSRGSITFIPFFLALVWIGTGVFMIANIADAFRSGSASATILAPLISTAIFAVLVIVSRNCAESEAQFLLDFMRETVDARASSGQASNQSGTKR